MKTTITKTPNFKDCALSNDRKAIFLEFDYVVCSNERLVGVFFNDELVEDPEVKIFSMKLQPLKILLPYNDKYKDIPTVTLKISGEVEEI